MGRVFKIVIWVLILFFLYSILSVTYEKCTETSEGLLDQAQNGVENVTDKVSDVAENANDEFFSDEESYGEDNSDLADQLFDDEEPQYKKEVKTEETYSEPALRKTYSSADGKYMVVAGNFLVEANAGNMVRKLNNLGYTAESVVFDESQYYTVLASRSDDYNQALSVSSQLKSRGIDNYVKSQKF